MPPYRAVLFDAGDTLIDFYGTGARVTRIVQEQTGQAIPIAQAAPYFEAAFHHAYAGQDQLLWVNTRAAEEVYWQGYYTAWLRAAGVPPTPALVAELVADTLQLDIYTPFADAVPTLQALTAAGVRLVLVSNAFPSMQAIMQHLDLERYFAACLYSCTIGHEKPQAAIFHLALDAAQAPAAAVCFIDDVPQHIEAARALGIPGYLLDRWDRHRHSPLPRITTLAALSSEF